MKTIQKIPLSHIDLHDETFSVNFMPDLEKLRSSIEEIGLIQPVLLRKKQGKYQIICGFRRVSVLKQMGGSDILSMVLGEEERDDLRLFLFSLHENLTSRGFNTIEMAIALDKLVHQFHVEPVTVIKKHLPLFDLEGDEKILKTYLSILPMEEEIKRYILKEKVSRTNIRRISVLSPKDRMALLSLISPLKLGENRLREILTLLEEVTKRDRLTIREVVKQPEIQAILSHRELTPSQRADRVKKVLVGLRYPQLHRLESRFERKKEELSLPPNVSLQHSPFFEGKGLKLELQFGTVKEFQSIISLLSRLTEMREFRELIENF
ncbi:MAG: ParB/RepB/Spo0J family partition protein [Thermodesulfobacteriota bacterium]